MSMLACVLCIVLCILLTRICISTTPSGLQRSYIVFSHESPNNNYYRVKGGCTACKKRNKIRF